MTLLRGPLVPIGIKLSIRFQNIVFTSLVMDEQTGNIGGGITSSAKHNILAPIYRHSLGVVTGPLLHFGPASSILT